MNYTGRPEAVATSLLLYASRCRRIIYWGRLCFSGTLCSQRHARLRWRVKFCGFPDVGHFKAPRGLTRFSWPAVARLRSVCTPNNTDLSHAKCDFISSSARAVKTGPFICLTLPRRLCRRRSKV